MKYGIVRYQNISYFWGQLKNVQIKILKHFSLMHLRKKLNKVYLSWVKRAHLARISWNRFHVQVSIFLELCFAEFLFLAQGLSFLLSSEIKKERSLYQEKRLNKQLYHCREWQRKIHTRVEDCLEFELIRIFYHSIILNV